MRSRPISAARPEQLSADAGYCSEANLEVLENRSIDGYVATGRARDAVAGTVKGEDHCHDAVAGAGRRTDTRRGHAPVFPAITAVVSLYGLFAKASDQ